MLTPIRNSASYNTSPLSRIAQFGPPHSEPSDPTLLSLMMANIMRTVPTFLSYDFSISIPILGMLMTRLGAGNAAPSVTTLLNAVGNILVAAVLPASFKLASLFGELEQKESERKRLHEQGGASSEVISATLEAEIKSIKQQIGLIPKNAIAAAMFFVPILLVLALAKQVLLLFGQSHEIAEDAQSFFKYYAPLFATLIARLAMEFVLLAAKKPFSAMVFSNLGLLVAVGLEYGLGFKTSLEIEGLGLGGGLGLSLTFVGFAVLVNRDFDGFGFFKRFLTWDAADWQYIKAHLIEALVMVAAMASDVSVPFAISVLSGLLPGEALTIQNVATQYLNWNLLITAAASQTTGLTVAENISKARRGGITYPSVKRSAMAGLMVNLALQLPLIMYVCAGTQSFLELLNTSLELAVTRDLLLLTALYAVLDGARYSLLQVMRAAGKNTVPSVASSCLLWCGVGLSYLLSQYTDLGVKGLPIGLIIGASLGLAFLVVQLQKGFTEAQLKEKEALIRLSSTRSSSSSLGSFPNVPSTLFWQDTEEDKHTLLDAQV